MSVEERGLIRRWRMIAVAMLIAGLVPLAPQSAEAATVWFKPTYLVRGGGDVPFPVTTCITNIVSGDVVDCFTYASSDDVVDRRLSVTSYQRHLVLTTTERGYFGQSLIWMSGVGSKYNPEIELQPYQTNATAQVAPALVSGAGDITVTFTSMNLGGKGETGSVSFALPVDFSLTSIGELQCHNTSQAAPCPVGVAVDQAGFHYQRLHDQPDRFSITLVGHMSASAPAGDRTFSTCSSINTITTCADATLTFEGVATETPIPTDTPTATQVPPTVTPTATATTTATNTATATPPAPTETPPPTATPGRGETITFRPSYAVSNSSGPLPFPFTTCVFEPDGAEKLCMTYTSQADIAAGVQVPGWEHRTDYPYTITAAGHHTLPRTLRTEGQSAFTGELLLYRDVLDVLRLSVEPATVVGGQIVTLTSRAVIGAPDGTNARMALTLPANFVATGIRFACTNGSGQDSCPPAPYPVDTSGFAYSKPWGGTDFWDIEVIGSFNALATPGFQEFGVCIFGGESEQCASASVTYTPASAATATSTPITTETPRPIWTATSTATTMPTGTMMPTSTGTATSAPTATGTATLEPTGTIASTATSTATVMPTSTGTATSAPTATGTATLEPTGTIASTATSTVTAEVTGTATVSIGTLVPTGTATLPTESPTAVSRPTGTLDDIPGGDPEASLSTLELPLVLADGGAFPPGSTVCVDGTDISACQPLFPELAVTIGVEVRSPSEVRVQFADLPPGHYTISLREMEPYLDMAFPVELDAVHGAAPMVMEPLVLPKAGIDPQASPVVPPVLPVVTDRPSGTEARGASADARVRAGSSDLVTTLPTTGLGEDGGEDSRFMPLVMTLVTMIVVIVAVWHVRRSRLP